MSLIDFFFNPNGRIGRKRFWIGTLAVLAAQFVALPAIATLFDGGWLVGLAAVLFNYPHFVVWAKRGHDCDIPAWVIAPLFLCSSAFDVVLRFGWHTGGLFDDPLFFAPYVLYAFFAAVLLLVLGVSAGTPGRNRYGPNPLEPQTLPARA